MAQKEQPTSLRGRTILGIVILVLGVITIGVIMDIAREEWAPSFLATQRTRIVAVLIGLFGVAVIEIWAEVIVRAFARSGSLQTGIALRAVIRMISYMVLLVSIVSILSSNPALAIGVGGVTGVIVAFSAQNLLANAFAGMFLAIGQPFRVGEEITVMGLTGRVIDIRVMHTTLDLGDRLALIPSNAMMAQAIQRRRRRRMAWEDYDDPKAHITDTDSPDA